MEVHSAFKLHGGISEAQNVHFTIINMIIKQHMQVSEFKYNSELHKHFTMI